VAKHACDAWMSSLTFEANVWGIEAATVCPCWHEIDIDYFQHDVFARLPLRVQVRWREPFLFLGGGGGGWKRGTLRIPCDLAVAPEFCFRVIIHSFDASFAGGIRTTVLQQSDGEQ
jgi:hypothetical protein